MGRARMWMQLLVLSLCHPYGPHRMLGVPGKAPCSWEVSQGRDGEPSLQWDKLCEQELVESKAKLCRGNVAGSHHNPTWNGPALPKSGVPSSTGAFKGIIVAFPGCHSLDLQTVNSLCVQGSDLRVGKIKGKVLTDYTRPKPSRYSGYHRYQFRLYRQSQHQTISLSSEEQASLGTWDLKDFVEDFHLGHPVASTQFLTKNYKD
ncbi:phosphatidylethanolamine-binding protein 4 isoform X1 [Serinus canaria]|uniref:phosphatidylethanolamine-binding protein 4 isoform X1 n=1 Tax=Serinus canaria TaxID=9135 RepID=UPI0021CCBB07|nr:phosphatidylethanolamine-binding protein 4 isoform X1 [Serinus canaria]